MDKNIEVKFQGEMDRFRGVTVTSAKEPCPLDQLEATMFYCTIEASPPYEKHLKFGPVCKNL